MSIIPRLLPSLAVVVSTMLFGPSVWAMNSASYRVQTGNSSWSPPLAGTNFRITFTEPDDPPPPMEGVARPYRPYVPPPPVSVAPPPVLVLPAPPVPAPTVLPVGKPTVPAPAPVLPVGKPVPVVAPPITAPVSTPPARLLPRKATTLINGVPQRYAAPPAPVVPVKTAPSVPAQAPRAAPAKAAAVLNVIPRVQLQKAGAPVPVTAPGSTIGRPVSQPLSVPRVQIPTTVSPQPKTSGIPGPVPRAQTSPVSPQTKTPAPPLSQQVKNRLESRMRMGIAFGASLLTDADGVLDPIRSGLLVFCLFLVLLLLHARRRLHALPPRLHARKRVGMSPFISRRIR